MNKGIATFTLDYGTCPKWLFDRMVKLGREMSYILVDEFGPDEFVKRISDPVWFQSLGTVLAFDWNASGLTTILTAALKEAIRGNEKELGVFICGGKGKTSRKTPDEIVTWGERNNFSLDQTSDLVYSSKMAAKVDSLLVQDGYQIYHHSFFFSRNGVWTVVQQGMNTDNQTARRYHWNDHSLSFRTRFGISDKEKKMLKPSGGRFDSTDLNDKSQVQHDITEKSSINFVEEPHTAISSQFVQDRMLNLVSKKSRKNRAVSEELVKQSYDSLIKDIQILRKHSTAMSKMIKLKTGDEQLTLLHLNDNDSDFRHHPVELEDFGKSKYLEKVLQRIAYEKPESYEDLIATKGVGPKTIRALSLVGEVIYGAKPSYEDPARYSFAHGGKDMVPYPVDTKTYDDTIDVLQQAVSKVKNYVLKDKALKQLENRKKELEISYEDKSLHQNIGI